MRNIAKDNAERRIPLKLIQQVFFLLSHIFNFQSVKEWKAQKKVSNLLIH